jgi:UDP-N-acetylglucosamine--N-acetylmuramyl-(pentapeptide) pyrophosphoryl-undecaprenol N-acetylglucosamine transferase
LLVVFGGSLGSARINGVVREALPTLLSRTRVLHVCGKGNRVARLDGLTGYEQVEYLDDFPQRLAKASLAIGRAGSNSLWELITLRVPHIVIPLPLSVSRGDQLRNAEYFRGSGATEVIADERLDAALLMRTIDKVSANAPRYVQAMASAFPHAASLDRLVAVIERLAG